jgi:hypothetical protein
MAVSDQQERKTEAWSNITGLERLRFTWAERLSSLPHQKKMQRSA